MSIYGDLGNTRCLAARIRRHGYSPVVHQHHPGGEPAEPHLHRRGRWPDSAGARRGRPRAHHGPRCELTELGTPMLMICGMYQLFGNAFITVEGKRLPGLGILDVTTQGNAKRMIGPVVLDTQFRGGRRLREPLGFDDAGEPARRLREGPLRVRQQRHRPDRGARLHNVIGSYLHGPILPANPALADALIGFAAGRATGRAFEPVSQDDAVADQAQMRQVRRLAG